MDTPIVPVTEAEMRDFFERVVSTIVSYSSQVKEYDAKLEALSSDLTATHTTLDQVREELQHLKDTNEQLRKSESDAWEHAQSEERQRIAEKEQREAAEIKAKNLEDAITSRDYRVKELEEALAQTQIERDNLRRDNERLLQDNSSLQSELGWAKQDVQSLTAQRDTANKERDQASTHLNEIRSVIERMQQATQVAWPQAASG